MTNQETSRPGPPPDLEQVLLHACGQAGFHTRRFRLLRHFANAVYLLEDMPIVARVAYGPDDAERSAIAVAITAWLAAQDLPVTEPATMPAGSPQPVVVRGCAVTFWRHYPQPDPPPRQEPADLARLARALHTLTTDPPVSLPVYQPLRSVSFAVEGARRAGTLDAVRLGWLADRIGQLRDEYRRLSFPLGTGLVHGDLHTGNLLCDGGKGVVLGDWDAISWGPREVDLIPSYAALRFGATNDQVDRFAAAYEYDLRTWPGYRVLREIRDISTLTALIRLAPTNPAAASQLAYRLDTLQRGDVTAVWTPW